VISYGAPDEVSVSESLTMGFPEIVLADGELLAKVLFEPISTCLAELGLDPTLSHLPITLSDLSPVAVANARKTVANRLRSKGPDLIQSVASNLQTKFGSHEVWCGIHPQVRMFSGLDRTGTPLHADSWYGHSRNCVVVWFALHRANSLYIVSRSDQGESQQHFQVRPGEAVVFGGDQAHGGTPSAPLGRLSVDIRVQSVSTPLAEKRDDSYRLTRLNTPSTDQFV